MSTSVKCKCNDCGTIWEPKPDSVINGAGCQTCWRKKDADGKRKCEEVFLRQVKKNNLISTYWDIILPIINTYNVNVWFVNIAGRQLHKV